MTILKKINFILSVDKKIKFYSLFFITFIVSFLDLIGLSAIFPILVIFTDPNFLDNKYIFLIQFFFYIFFLISLYYLKLSINLILIFMTVIYITLLTYAKFRKKL